jgi:hypothetical protein
MMEAIYILQNIELSPNYTALPYSAERLAALFSVTDVLASKLFVISLSLPGNSSIRELPSIPF